MVVWYVFMLLLSLQISLTADRGVRCPQGMMITDVFKVDLATSLWSSEALIKSPESVLEAHLLFLQSGARLIETAS